MHRVVGIFFGVLMTPSLLEMTISYLAAQQPLGNPLPDEFPPLPEGYVYLGRGRQDNDHEIPFGLDPTDHLGPNWHRAIWGGFHPRIHYACTPEQFNTLKDYYDRN